MFCLFFLLFCKYQIQWYVGDKILSLRQFFLLLLLYDIIERVLIICSSQAQTQWPRLRSHTHLLFKLLFAGAGQSGERCLEGRESETACSVFESTFPVIFVSCIKPKSSSCTTGHPRQPLFIFLVVTMGLTFLCLPQKHLSH